MTAAALFRFEHSATDDTGPVQMVDGLGHANETFKKLMRLQPHGFTSSPPVGSHGLGLRLRGESDLAIALMLEHQDKRQKNLSPGQAVVYDDQGNVSRYLGADGIWHDAGDRAHKLTGKTVTLMAKGGNASIGSDQKTYLGGDGTDGSYAAVMTVDGPSSVVFAKL